MGFITVKRCALPSFISLAVVLVLQLGMPGRAFSEQAGTPAPDFELAGLDGKTYHLADFRGKVVVLNFWASWCPECIEELPSLNAFYQRNRKADVIVLGITADRKKEPVLEVMKKTPVGYPVLLETGGSVFIRKYVVIGMPTTIVVDRNGIIAGRIIGRTDFGSAVFSRKIQELLGKGRNQ